MKMPSEHRVRWNACEALGALGEKAATSEVITALVTAMGDENGSVRGNACRALGALGEKAATSEVITALVTAMGDENGECSIMPASPRSTRRKSSDE